MRSSRHGWRGADRRRRNHSDIHWHAPKQAWVIQHDAVFIHRQLCPETSPVEIFEEIESIR